jgi:hypothetical protein
MDEQASVTTRRALHGVAELLLAGPQYREHGTIRLRVTPGGFGAVAEDVRVDGAQLVWPGGKVALIGTVRELAAALKVQPGPPEGLYSDTSGWDVDEPLTVDEEAARALADWFARGDAALRTLDAGEPVLWPEHFDLGVGADEVNYGVSPGDAGHAGPYAYVGPWTPRTGDFWNVSFGALRPMSELPDADAMAAFFAEGRRLAG